MSFKMTHFLATRARVTDFDDLSTYESLNYILLIEFDLKNILILKILRQGHFGSFGVKIRKF